MNGCMWCYSIFHSATKPCNDSPIIYAGSSKDLNKTKYGKNEKVLIYRDYAIACSSLCDSVNSVFSMFNPSYDADGNMTSVQTSTGTWAVEYNAENRPVRWTNASTGTVITMTFDSQGRRTEYKSVTNGAQNTWLRFLYDGYLCVQVLYSNEPYNVFKEFVWDPTEPVATRPLVFRYAPNSLNLFYAFDGNKNVSDVFYRMTSNGIGAHYDYAPFGGTTRTHRDSSASFDIVALNPFRFSSEHYDSELDLVYYNYRHYSPSLGRFLSRDPIEEQGGLNLYAFVGNSFLLDFLGLDSVSCENEKDIGNIDFDVSHMGFVNASARGNSTVFGNFENLVSKINTWGNLRDVLNIGSVFLTGTQAEFLSSVFSGYAINFGYGGYINEGLGSAKKGIQKIEDGLRKKYGLRLDTYIKYKRCKCYN